MKKENKVLGYMSRDANGFIKALSAKGARVAGYGYEHLSSKNDFIKKLNEKFPYGEKPHPKIKFVK